MATSPQPSHYQQAIIDATTQAVRALKCGQPYQNIVVEATAGAGKTSTILLCIQALTLSCPGSRSVVVAFNKRVADEMAARLPSTAKAMTLHSLGRAAWVRTVGRQVEVDGNKIGRIVQAEIDANRMPRWLRGKVAKLVDLARMHGIVPGATIASTHDDCVQSTASHSQASPPTATPASTHATALGPLQPLLDDVDAEWERLMLRFDVSFDDTATSKQIIRHARDVLTTSNRYGHRIIDFVDMLYLPTLCAATRWDIDADVVFVDELQDLDVLQQKMLQHLIRHCVFVGVGDPQQAVYSWRGADADAMQRIATATRAKTLPLSICYRCPSGHIQAARKWSPRIEAAPGACPGVFERYDAEGKLACNSVAAHGDDCECRLGANKRLQPTDFQPGDIVICRAKAPLVKMAFWLMRARRPCRILGRNLASPLLSFIDSMRCTDVPSLLRKVNMVTQRLILRALDLDDETVAEEARDRQAVIVAVADGYDGDDVAELRAELEALFGDGEDRGSVVTLSTVHKFKGGEADRVWWLDHHKPDPESRGYKHDWQRTEAGHIRFVAMTRARRELRFFRSEGLTAAG